MREMAPIHFSNAACPAGPCFMRMCRLMVRRISSDAASASVSSDAAAAVATSATRCAVKATRKLVHKGSMDSVYSGNKDELDEVLDAQLANRSQTKMRSSSV